MRAEEAFVTAMQCPTKRARVEASASTRDEIFQAPNEIGAVEKQISALDQEIELWELRIAAVRDRQELSRRLRWVQSDLADIDVSKVIEIESAAPAEAPVVSAY